MKLYSLIFFILIIFFKTGNVLSSENIFNVNNIELSKNTDFSNEQLANQAIKLAFNELKKKILLNEDSKKLSYLKPEEIRELVLYYQIITPKSDDQISDKVKFNIFFDKEKLHNLFYNKDILYSEILDKEIYLLPVFKRMKRFLFLIKIFSIADGMKFIRMN